LIEHRVFHRLSVRLRVRYVIATPRGRVAGEGSTANLSAGGMLLSVADITQAAVADLLEGAGTVEVQFGLAPGEPDIAGRCRLVWMQGPKRPGEGFDLGLRFVDMPASIRDRLHAFVTQPVA